MDDDPQTPRYVRGVLAEAGYAPVTAGKPQEVPELIQRTKPALVLLDLRLPGADGIELMRRVPDLGDVPIIFISAYGDETIAPALEMGAADYVVKPFSPTELTARIAAALRWQSVPAPFVLGDLVIQYEQRQVTVSDRHVQLTATEFDLLRVLSTNAGRVMTHDALLRAGDRRHSPPGRGIAHRGLSQAARAGPIQGWRVS